MRIALITDGIWPYVLGGMQKHSYYLCKYLAQNKVHVHLFHFNQGPYDIGKLEFFSEAEKTYITAVVVPFPTSPSFPGHYIYNSYRHSKLIYERLNGQLDQFDFIYTKGFTGWYLMRQKEAGVACPPIGVNFHGYEMFQKPPGIVSGLQYHLLLRKPVRWLTRSADLVFSYGGKITGIIRSLGVPEHRIFELPSGVERDMVATAIKPFVKPVNFVFLGRYERRKGIEELNQALLALANQPELSFSFHFIGPIDAGKRIDTRHVHYHGEIRDKAALQKLLGACDVLVCCSWSEGMPNVILEAMASGLAVLATDAGAVRVLVNEKTGWLINQPDPRLIQHTLETVMRAAPMAIDQKKQSALDLIGRDFVWEKLIHSLITRLGKAK